MIEYRKGDLLSVDSGVIIHQVNCQGVMGSGVAKAIREKYPSVYTNYRSLFLTHRSSGTEETLLSKVQVVKVTDKLEVLNLFGQVYYGTDGYRYTSYDALDDAFSKIRDLYSGSSIAFNLPKIGCGLGGADWNIVKEIIEKHLYYRSNHSITVWEL